MEQIPLVHGTQKALELLKNIKDKSVKQSVTNSDSEAAACDYSLDLFLAAQIPIHDIPSRGCELGTRWMKYPIDGISCLDHRLKLYLEVKVFSHENEEPRVIARVCWFVRPLADGAFFLPWRFIFLFFSLLNRERCGATSCHHSSNLFLSYLPIVSMSLQ